MAAPKMELVTTQPSLARKALGQVFAPAKLLRERKIRRVLYAAGFAAAAVGLCAAIWRNIREDVYALPEYQVPVAELHVTPAPAWLHARANVRNDVVRDASLGGNMSLLNERLTVDVARAFALHPWVEEVVGVQKSFPARLDVELKYRRPMCLVAVAEETYVVDASGVLLPREDIPAAELATLPRLTGVDAPTSLAGVPWGDVRVSDGAAIAAALREDWPTLGLREIVPYKPESTLRGSRYRFVLLTLQGRVITWGFAPTAGVTEGVDLATKLTRLRDAQKGQTAPVRSDGTPVMEPTRRVEDLTRVGGELDSR